MSSFQFLFIGGVAAIGAALALGTIAAMVTYRRTGHFPGDEEGVEREVTAGMRAALWARILVGVGLAVWGVASLASSDLL